MNKESKYIAIISAAMSAAFIGCLIITAFIYSKKTQDDHTQELFEKKYVYVVASENEDELYQKENEDVLYTVKEYFGKIGVFDEDGVLVNMIEVYTKTLPKADRILLREGITVTSKQALDALIEDYSS